MSRSGKVFSVANGMKEIESDSLEKGQYVSYGDMANSRKTGIVVQEKGNQYGQKVVFENGSTSRTSMTSIEGPGGWRLENGIADDATINSYLKKMKEKQRKDHETRRDKAERERAIREKGEQLFDELKPDWAESAIVAVKVKDKSDIRTDYFSLMSEKTVVLAWSKHTQRRFSEMRKAAKLDNRTEHLAVDNPDNEHREDYSMGDGYYLKEGMKYSDGWKVKKVKFHQYSKREIIKALGNGNYNSAVRTGHKLT